MVVLVFRIYAVFFFGGIEVKVLVRKILVDSGRLLVKVVLNSKSIVFFYK